VDGRCSRRAVVTITMCRMAHDESSDGWPPERPPTRDTRVIAAVHGAHHAVTRRLEISTREHGLDAGEALVLDTILRDQGCAPWEIRRQIGLRPSTLSSILDRLERESCIDRRQNSFDRRRFEIRLTTAGRISAGLAEFAIADVEGEIGGYTSRAERQGAVAVYEACVAVGRRERGASRWE
jgi:MarR family transcriptional regulator, organic hydroperoxide resistance regulator